MVVKMMAHGDETRNSMVLVDLLPGGFEVVPDSLKTIVVSNQEDSSDESEGESEEASESDGSEAADDSSSEEEGTVWSTEATDIREDRVLAFGSIPTDTVVFRYTIKPVNAGNFVIPPAYAESMYDRTVKARGLSDRITVVPAAK